ncbi:MAG: UDP-N-acetylmuramoyl-L-alanyl-D-glutamate--2,6-diaminopimelate ligase [Elusimicrobiota bacterium]
MMPLEQVLEGVGPLSVSGPQDGEILHMTFDSRLAKPQSVFFTLPGALTDGNRYVRQAIEKGAVAVLSELQLPPAPIALVRPGTLARSITWVQVRDVFTAMGRAAANFYRDPSADMRIVGITGTNGKTTTAYFLEAIFSRAGGVPGVIGTVSHRLRHRRIETAANTTPFSLDLQRLLARMRDGGGTHAVMEISSHALATKRADEIHYDAAVFTNLQSDHLDFHKSRKQYFDAKARLFELLERADSRKETRVAVLNRDDETYERLRHRISELSVVSYGFGPESDYIAEGAAYSLEGTMFRIRRKDDVLAVRLHLLGEHNVRNALAAAACAAELGVEPRAIAEGLDSVKSVPGRLEPVRAGQGFSVLVDYAHTESALESTLASLRALPHRKIITVFGCGGDRDASKRGPMGVAACSASDLAIATSDNPRGEDPMAILREIEDGLRQRGCENYRIVPDREEAILEAMRFAQQGDIVLIAGKGHEKKQILRDRTITFDDAEIARTALKDSGKI